MKWGWLLLLLVGGLVSAAEPTPKWRLLAVTLLEADGRPAAGVRVTLAGLGRDALPAGNREKAVPDWDFTTDAQGQCEVRLGCHPATEEGPHAGAPGWGTYYLIAQAPGRGAVVSSELIHAAQRDGAWTPESDPAAWGAQAIWLNRPRTSLRLQLRHGPAFTGQVVDAQQKAVAGVKVGIYHDLGYGSHTGWGGEFFRQTAVTDGEGHFRFAEVYPHRFYLALEEPAEPWHWLQTWNGAACVPEVLDTINVPADAREVSAQIIVTRDLPYRYFGRVKDQDGRPIEGAKVALGLAQRRSLRTYGDTHTFAEARTDGQGNWEIKTATQLARGWRVEASGFAEAMRWEEDEQPPRFLPPGEYEIQMRAAGEPQNRSGK